MTSLDTDPVNGSLSAITALNATHVNLLQGDRIDIEGMDALVERVITEDTNFVIDSASPPSCPSAATGSS